MLAHICLDISFRITDILFWPWWALHRHGIYACVHIYHTHTTQDKYKSKDFCFKFVLFLTENGTYKKNIEFVAGSMFWKDVHKARRQDYAVLLVSPLCRSIVSELFIITIKLIKVHKTPIMKGEMPWKTILVRWIKIGYPEQKHSHISES